MTEFKHIVTEEDKAQELDIKGIMRQHFKFSSRLRNKIKREKLKNGTVQETKVKVQSKGLLARRESERRQFLMGGV